jgi:hypothetical protein
MCTSLFSSRLELRSTKSLVLSAGVDRRALTTGLSTTLLLGRAFAHTKIPSPTDDLPPEVVGIAIPRTLLSKKVVAFCRTACPDYLFHHSLRTFVFGALHLKRRNMRFNAEDAFIAAMMHDLGLLKAFESQMSSFEIDGADRAEQLMLEAGAPRAAADVVWHAIEMHDGKWALTARQGPEAMLVAIGASSDVDGVDAGVANAVQLAEVVTVFPRLQFKRRFTKLLIDHCKRKPTSQRGTWLEGLCREQVPSAWAETVEKEIAGAPFRE